MYKVYDGFKCCTFQVPGRIGLLVTLFLISSNIYGSLEAPKQRGFSFLEFWVLGTQGIILLAILEYGIILGWKKYGKENVVDPKTGKWFDEKCLDNTFKLVDLISFIFSLLIIFIFIISYTSGFL